MKINAVTASLNEMPPREDGSKSNIRRLEYGTLSGQQMRDDEQHNTCRSGIVSDERIYRQLSTTNVLGEGFVCCCVLFGAIARLDAVIE